MSMQFSLLKPVGFLMTLTLLSGCSLAEWHSINTDHNFNGEQSSFIDAKQRVVLNIEKKEYAENPDGSIKRNSKNEPVIKDIKNVVCAEPSPDALSALAAYNSLDVKAGENNGSVGVTNSTREAVMNIGLRTQTIQILRDMSYRLCEAYANDAISKTDYISLIRQHQRSMIVFLGIEQMTSPWSVSGGNVEAPNPTPTKKPAEEGHGGSEPNAVQGGTDKPNNDAVQEPKPTTKPMQPVGNHSTINPETAKIIQYTIGNAMSSSPVDSSCFAYFSKHREDIMKETKEEKIPQYIYTACEQEMKQYGIEEKTNQLKRLLDTYYFQSNKAGTPEIKNSIIDMFTDKQD